MKTVEDKNGKVVSAHAMMAHRRGRDTDLLILYLSTRCEWSTSLTGRFTPRKEHRFKLLTTDGPNVLGKKKDYFPCRDSNPGPSRTLIS
jgi:hypothetical protein